MYYYRFCILVLILLFSSFLSAQDKWRLIRADSIDPKSFLELPNVEYGSIAFADVDGDNDQDVLICGKYNFNHLLTTLYINDGNGYFLESRQNNFAGFWKSAVAFEDVDGDSDLDLVISGDTSATNQFGVQAVTRLYLNNGSGRFSRSSQSFIAYYSGNLEFADLDGDNDQDLFLNGYGNGYASIYRNNGSGSFQRINSNSIPSLFRADLSFADVDGDSDLDLFFCGRAGPNIYSDLYLNDGSANFAKDTTNSFTSVANGSLIMEDLDNDQDIDLIISGDSSLATNNAVHSSIHLNDGLGNFSRLNPISIPALGRSELATTDLNRDSLPDLIVSGYDGSQYVSETYINNGQAAFSKLNNPAIEGVIYGTTLVADFDNDNDLDMVHGGNSDTSSSSQQYYFYTQDSSGIFTQVKSSPFNARSAYLRMAIGDINGDSLVDILYPQLNGGNFDLSTYINAGSNRFIKHLPSSSNTIDSTDRILLGDVDGDQDLDLLAFDVFSRNYADLYLNNGLGQFNLQTRSVIQTQYNVKDIRFADFNGDSNLDLIVSGLKAGSQAYLNIYLNNGLGGFSAIANLPIDSGFQLIEVGDLDGDQDIDLLLEAIGLPGGFNDTLKIYLNNGNATFSPLTGLPTIFQGRVDAAISDVNLDGINDIIISGVFYQPYQIATYIFLHNGNGNFTVKFLTTPSNPIGFNSIDLSDIDGDLDLDLLTCGADSSGTKVCHLFTNDGQANFQYVSTPQIIGIEGKVLFADLDSDHDPDLFTIGVANYKMAIAYAYENLNCQRSLVQNQGNFLLALDDAANYQWLNCNNNYAPIPGATNKSFWPTSNGSYALELTKNGCADTSACENVTSVLLNEFAPNQIEAYLAPNPTNGQTTISINQKADLIALSIRNSIGQEIFTKTYSNTNTLTFNLDAHKGLYFLTLQIKEQSKQFKLVKY